MIRRRNFTPAIRRRLAELDAKPGLGEQVIAEQASASSRRLAVIDQQPEAWRALLNDYPHQFVAVVAESCGDPQRARIIIEGRLGKPI